MRTLTKIVSTSTALAFERAVVQSPDLGIQTTINADVIPEWSSFAREVFAALVEPSTPEVAEPLPFDRWAVAAHRRVDQAANVPQLRAACIGSPAAAAAATASILAAVATTVRMAETRARLRRIGGTGVDPVDAQAATRALDELEARDLPDDVKEAATSESLDMLRKAKAGETMREAMADRIDDAPLSAIAAGVDAAIEDAEKVAGVVRVLRWCGVGGPDGHVEDDIPIGTLTQLANDPTLLAIVRMMGRLVASAGAQVRKAETGRCDVVGVELGGDVGSFVPVELALLGTEREDDLMRRTVERGVVSWQYHGDDAVDQGDLLVMFDRSGSMRGARIVFARAIVGAMVVLARRQRRRVVVCAFDHAQEIRVCERDGAGFGEALSLVFLAARGGTQVRAALEACRPYAAKADACIVTDGVFGVDEGEGARWLRAAGGHIHVIGLECSVDAHASWATRVVRVDDVNNDDIGARIVASVVKGNR